MSDESSASRKYIRYFWTIYVAVAVLVLFIFFLIARGFLGFYAIL